MHRSLSATFRGTVTQRLPHPVPVFGGQSGHRVVDAPHHPKIQIADHITCKDHDVSRVWIGMEEAIHKDLLEDQVCAACCYHFSVKTLLFQPIDVLHFDAIDVLHRENFHSCCLRKDF